MQQSGGLLPNAGSTAFAPYPVLCTGAANLLGSTKSHSCGFHPFFPNYVGIIAQKYPIVNSLVRNMGIAVYARPVKNRLYRGDAHGLSN